MMLPGSCGAGRPWSGVPALKLPLIAAPERLVAGVYVVLGWVGLALLPEVVASAGALPALLFVAGGLLYTAGAVVYVRAEPIPARPCSASTRSSTCS